MAGHSFLVLAFRRVYRAPSTKLALGIGVCFRARVPNLYLLMKRDGTSDEISADFYERDGDDWIFTLSGDEVARIAIDDIVSVAKAPRDMK
jgi:hypothetical protein